MGFKTTHRRMERVIIYKMNGRTDVVFRYHDGKRREYKNVGYASQSRLYAVLQHRMANHPRCPIGHMSTFSMHVVLRRPERVVCVNKERGRVTVKEGYSIRNYYDVSPSSLERLLTLPVLGDWWLFIV